MAEDMALISLANYDDAISAAKEKSGNPAPMTSAELAPRIRSIRTAPADPHTLLLIHGDKIEDASMYGVPLTNNGVVVSSNQSKFGGKSLYFNGDSWVNFPEKYAAYRDKDFTIDWWEYCMTSDVNHQSRYFSTDAGGPYSTLGLLLGHLGKQAYCGNGWSMINGAEMFNIVQRQWVHWATVRSGNTLYTFRNGVKFAQTPIVGSIPYDEKTSHCIGGWRYSPGQKWIGYMSEFRISNVARWTSDFVPADKPYDNIDRTIIEPLEVAENGVYTAEHGRAYNPVSVKCPAPKSEQEKTVTANKNGPVVLTPDPGKVMSKATVTVAVPSGKKPNIQPITIKENGTVTASAGTDGYSPITVDVPKGVDISPFYGYLRGEFTAQNDMSGKFIVPGTKTTGINVTRHIFVIESNVGTSEAKYLLSGASANFGAGDLYHTLTNHQLEEGIAYTTGDNTLRLSFTKFAVTPTPEGIELNLIWYQKLKAKHIYNWFYLYG